MENNIIKLKRVVIKEELFSITNDTFEAIILGQMIYWQERVNDFDKFIKEEKERSKKNDVDININDFNGWIYKKANELSNECMLNLSDVSIRRYINKLIDKKFIFCRTNPLYKWDKTLQYRTNLRFIIESIKKNGYDGLSGYSLSKERNEGTKLQNECSVIHNEVAIPEITNIDFKEDTNVSKKENEIEVESKNEDYIKFRKWMKENCPFCDNPKNFASSRISEKEFEELKSKFTGAEIASVILEIENRKDLRKKYCNLYRTTLNWLKNNRNK